MTLSITTRKYNPEVTVIELAGRITLGRESGQIEATVLQVLHEGVRKIVIDLSRVDYIDSTGIGKIAYAFGKITQAGAEARVSGARGLVYDLFKITRLDRVIRFLPDADTAAAELASEQKTSA
ncbi:MAG TPA: STAS domain-containing protein [Bryobacteraceae bacterium]|nr:STAS domain-containing protein [Bryobacteraceae bacterium]